MKVDPTLIVNCDFNQDYAYIATKELLSSKRKPDAIFTISDRMAIGAMLAIKEKGLRMPEDIGLVGFNNEPVVSLVTPAISSIEQPAFELGKIAAKLFIEALHQESDHIPEEQVLKPKLMVRASSQKITPKTTRR
jgi:LacI family transcriptional regulator